ncbi:MAG: hypothetical protein AAFQ82_12220, partial [Myxococcota bacterium]
MRRVFRVRFAAVVWAVFGAGCVETIDAGPDAAIDCAGPEDCPAGFTCREEVGLCVRNEDAAA